MRYVKRKRHYEYELTSYESFNVIGLPNVLLRSPGDKRPFLFIQGGRLLISPEYAWDGPSGPTIDTKSFMRGSLAHDALYQLMREGKLNRHYRKYTDRLLKKICLEDGMNKFRAWYVYKAVRMFGEKRVYPDKNENKVIEIFGDKNVRE